jgi:hypothetical protein
MRLNVGAGLLLGKRSEPQVGLDDAEVWEQSLRLVVLDRGVDNDVVTGNPIDWGGDPVLVASLQRVEHAENFGGVAAGRGGIGQDQADRLLGVDDEDGTDGESNALGVDIGGILVVNPGCWVRLVSDRRAVSQLTCRMPTQPSSPCLR